MRVFILILTCIIPFFACAPVVDVYIREEIVVLKKQHPALCSTVACGLCVVLLDILQPFALSPKVDTWASSLAKHVCDMQNKTDDERFTCWVIMYDTLKMLLHLFHDMDPLDACKSTALCTTESDVPLSFIVPHSNLTETSIPILKELNCSTLGHLFHTPEDIVIETDRLVNAVFSKADHVTIPPNRRKFINSGFQLIRSSVDPLERQAF